MGGRTRNPRALPASPAQLPAAACGKHTQKWNTHRVMLKVRRLMPLNCLPPRCGKAAPPPPPKKWNTHRVMLKVRRLSPPWAEACTNTAWLGRPTWGGGHGGRVARGSSINVCTTQHGTPPPAPTCTHPPFAAGPRGTAAAPSCAPRGCARTRPRPRRRCARAARTGWPGSCGASNGVE